MQKYVYGGIMMTKTYKVAIDGRRNVMGNGVGDEMTRMGGRNDKGLKQRRTGSLRAGVEGWTEGGGGGGECGERGDGAKRPVTRRPTRDIIGNLSTVLTLQATHFSWLSFQYS